MVLHDVKVSDRTTGYARVGSEKKWTINYEEGFLSLCSKYCELFLLILDCLHRSNFISNWISNCNKVLVLVNHGLVSRLRNCKQWVLVSSLFKFEFKLYLQDM